MDRIVDALTANVRPFARQVQAGMEQYPKTSSAVGQVLGGAVGGPLGGIAGGMVPLAVAKKGVPDPLEAAGVVASELAPPLARKALGAAGTGIRQALQGSEMAQKAASVVGPLYRNVTEEAGHILKGAKDTIANALPEAAKVLTGTLKTWGLDITKLSEKEFVQRLRAEPERMAAAIKAFEYEAGHPIAAPGTLQKLWVSDVLRSTGKVARGGAVQQLPGLMVEPGGNLILNGPAIADAWKALTPEGQLTFGPEGKEAFNGLVAKMQGLGKATKGVRQLALDGGDIGKIPMQPWIAAAQKVFHSIPGGLQKLARGGSMLAGGYEAMQHPGLVGIPMAGAAVIKMGKRAGKAVIEKALGTPEGVKWLTQGVDMMSKGLPTVMIMDALSRSAMRFPALLASWGLQPPPQQGPGR
jgi:hypothetical protein